MLSIHFHSLLFCVDCTRTPMLRKGFSFHFHSRFHFHSSTRFRKNEYREHISVTGCILFWGVFLSLWLCWFWILVPPTRKSIFLFANFQNFPRKKTCFVCCGLWKDLWHELRTWTFCLIGFYELMPSEWVNECVLFVFSLLYLFRTG